MSKITRRNVLGAAAALASGALAVKAVAAAEKEATPAKPRKESVYKFRLQEAPARMYADGSIKEHKTSNFPISASMSGGAIRLAPGGFREPHWHPNSDEWLYVLVGTIRMTIVNPKGEADRFDCGVGDVSFTPQGFGHYVENVGEDEAHVLVVHNNGDFTTIELSEWVAGGSLGVFASTLNIPESAFKDSPKKRVYITKRKKPN